MTVETQITATLLAMQSRPLYLGQAKHDAALRNTRPTKMESWTTSAQCWRAFGASTSPTLKRTATDTRHSTHSHGSRGKGNIPS